MQQLAALPWCLFVGRMRLGMQTFDVVSSEICLSGFRRTESDTVRRVVGSALLHRSMGSVVCR